MRAELPVALSKLVEILAREHQEAVLRERSGAELQERVQGQRARAAG